MVVVVMVEEVVVDCYQTPAEGKKASTKHTDQLSQ